MQAYGNVSWDVAPRSPITAEDVAVAESERAVGFFGSPDERDTLALREYLRAMAEAAAPDEPVATSSVAEALDRTRSWPPPPRRPTEEGPDYSGQHGYIAFTVSQFRAVLRELEA